MFWKRPAGDYGMQHGEPQLGLCLWALVKATSQSPQVISQMGLSEKLGGTLFWGRYSKDPTILGVLYQGPLCSVARQEGLRV